MADEKKSSIYDDNTSSELDEYGVWVKSKPMDVGSDGAEISDDSLADLEAELGALEELPLDEAGDSSAMSFDTIELPEDDEPQEEINVADILAADDDFKVEEIPEEELSNLEGSVIHSEVPAIDAAVPEEPKEDSVSETLKVAEPEEESTEPVTAKPVAETEQGKDQAFIENFLDDSPFDDDENLGTGAEEETDEGTSDLEDDGETIFPELSSNGEASDEIDDLPEAIDIVGTSPTITAEQAPSGETEAPAEQAPSEAVTEPIVAEAPDLAETETVEEEASTVEPVLEPDAEAPKAEAAVEPVLEPEAKAPKAEGAVNLSTELLLRIAEELSSIRKELSSLKQDFLEHRAAEPAHVAPLQEPELGVAEEADLVPEKEVHLEIAGTEPALATESENEPVEPQHTGGFFDDGGDEKIALTGAELDNILMSADFTEEAGTEVSNDFEEESDSETTSEEAMVVIDPTKDSEELQRLREEGAPEPITEAPEDTSILDDEIELTDRILGEEASGSHALDGISFDDSELDVEDEAIASAAIKEAEAALAAEAEEVLVPEVELETEPAFSTAEDLGVPENLPEQEAEPEIEIHHIEEEPVPVKLAHHEEAPQDTTSDIERIPAGIKEELKTVLSYMDQLLESLPEEKIEEFAASKYFDIYKKLFTELGLI